MMHSHEGEARSILVPEFLESICMYKRDKGKRKNDSQLYNHRKLALSFMCGRPYRKIKVQVLRYIRLEETEKFLLKALSLG